MYRSIIHEYSLTSLANLYFLRKVFEAPAFFTNELINLIKVYHLTLKKTMLPKKYFLEF